MVLSANETSSQENSVTRRRRHGVQYELDETVSLSNVSLRQAVPIASSSHVVKHLAPTTTTVTKYHPRQTAKYSYHNLYNILIINFLLAITYLFAYYRTKYRHPKIAQQLLAFRQQREKEVSDSTNNLIWLLKSLLQKVCSRVTPTKREAS